MQITKPGWLTSFLESLNIHAGDWVHQSLDVMGFHIYTLDIPPFSVLFGDWIEWSLDWVFALVNEALNALDTVKLAATDFFSYMSNVWDHIYQLADDAVAWIANAVDDTKNWVLAKISGVIQYIDDQIVAAAQSIGSTLYDFQTSILQIVADGITEGINQFRAEISEQLNLVGELAGELKDFVEDPGGYILEKLEEALDRLW